MEHKVYFDTLKVEVNDLEGVKQRAEEKKVNLRYFEDATVGVTLDETTKSCDLADLVYVFNGTGLKNDEVDVSEIAAPLIGNSDHARVSPFLEHPVFNTHHSEAQLVR